MHGVALFSSELHAMIHDLIRIGKAQPRYTTRGNLSSYSIEMWHDGLKEHREIKCSDFKLLQNKVNAVALKWQEKWEGKQCQLARQASIESAEAETAEAEKALRECETLLSHTLEIDDRVNWDSLKSHAPFEWSGPDSAEVEYAKKSNEPVAIVEPNKPTPPKPEQFTPHLSWYHFIFNKLKQRIIDKAEAEYRAAEDAYHANCTAWQNERTRRNALLTNEQKQFSEAKTIYEQTQAAVNAKVDGLNASWRNHRPDAVTEHADLVLSSSDYPHWAKRDYEIEYEPTGRMLVVDFRLPAPSELPSLEKVTFIKSKGGRVEKFISDSRTKQLFDSVCYQMALRTIHELFEADETGALASITFNGWVEATDPSTGLETKSCILSVQALKEEFLAFNYPK